MSAHTDPDASQGADVPAALALRVRQEEQIGQHQRFVEHATGALGRPRTI